MAIDLTKLSNEELVALQSGDLSKLSDETLKLIDGGSTEAPGFMQLAGQAVTQIPRGLVDIVQYGIFLQ